MDRRTVNRHKGGTERHRSPKRGSWKAALWVALLLAALALGWWGGRTAPAGEQAKPAEGVISGVEIVSDDRRENGALYGPFDVVVTLVNPGPQAVEDFKLVVQLVKSYRNYPNRMPDVEAQMAYVESVPPGGSRQVRLTGFRPGHPALVHELIVAAVGADGVHKVPLRVMFPPGTED